MSRVNNVQAFASDHEQSALQRKDSLGQQSFVYVGPICIREVVNSVSVNVVQITSLFTYFFLGPFLLKWAIIY